MKLVSWSFILTVILLGVSNNALAGAWSSGAIPTGLDIVRGEGFMVYGSFGNGAGCTVADRVFIQSDAPAYKDILAVVLMAQAQQKSIQFWINSCEPRSWYAVTTTTFNTVSVNATVMLTP